MALQVALVTGCSEGGIGYAFAEEFTKRGCITYASARSVEKMSSLPPSTHRLAIDVTDDESAAAAVETVIREQGRIDILVNNAGLSRMGPVLDVPVAQIQQLYDANVFGTIRMCKAVVPHMASRRSGLVINIGSIGGVFPTPWSGIYASSKAAIHSLSQTLAMELEPFNVKIMLVAPGAVKSHIADQAMRALERPSGSLYNAYAQSILRRINMSQRPGALPANEFAKRIIDEALRKNPPFYISIAPSALTFKIFSWLPSGIVRYILSHFFMTLPKKD